MTTSAKALFRATRAKPDRGAVLIDVEESRAPEAERRAHDFYPTGQTDAIRTLMDADGDRIRGLRHVWEPACGAGDLVHVIRAAGILCTASDLIDRGCPDSWLADYFTMQASEAPAIITNPPYNLINARDGAGRWLRHTLNMPGWRYMALLLSWDWPAARANGLGDLLDANPFSWCYLMRWKLDFTGGGSPPQRNAWFVWDKDDPRGYGPGQTQPSFRFLDRRDNRQPSLNLETPPHVDA